MKKLLFMYSLVLFTNFTSKAQTLSTCCPPLSREDVTNNLFKTDQNPGSLTSPYFLTFKPTTAFKEKMSAYVNYLLKLCPGKKFVISYEVAKVPNVGGLPTSNTPNYVCKEWHIFTTGNEQIGNIQFGHNAYCHPGETALSGKWFQLGDVYCFKVSVGSDPGPACFGNDCQPKLFWIKVPSIIDNGAKQKTTSQGNVPNLEIYDEAGKKF